MSVRRIVGTETEFGILESADSGAGPIALSADLVEAYSRKTGGATGWDFHGEDPLNDARGYRLERGAADPSMLTDNSEYSAPAFGNPERVTDVASLRRPRAANLVLANGARLYVDHAHPEYSSPETSSPRAAVLWDRAGEAVAVGAMDQLRSEGREVAVYKNNVDGKGAAYGSHENYLMSRDTSFADVVRYMTPFFVTRPILCGAGRVGLGQSSEFPGFQISQRADYVENDVGLETTFNRPIINTRDEPHADYSLYRRLHVIGGDANLFDISNLLKIGTTSAVLWLIEIDEVPLALDSALLYSPVAATWQVSHDPEAGLDMYDGTTKTASQIQRIYLDAVREAVERHGGADPDTAEVLEYWQLVLDLLDRRDWEAAAPMVEWVAKRDLLEGMRERGHLAWDDDKLRALDLQWHDLRPGKSIVEKLDAAGRVKRLFSRDEVERAAAEAPKDTRAFLRGGLVSKFGAAVPAAGWDGVILDDSGDLVRLPTLHPHRATEEYVGHMLAESQDVGDFLRRLTAE